MKMVKPDQGDNYLFWNPQECMIESIKYGHLQIPLHSTPFSPRIGFISLLVFMTFLCLNDDISLHSYVPVLRGQKFPSFHFWDFVLFTHFGFFVCLLSSSFSFSEEHQLSPRLQRQKELLQSSWLKHDNSSFEDLNEAKRSHFRWRFGELISTSVRCILFNWL